MSNTELPRPPSKWDRFKDPKMLAIACLILGTLFIGISVMMNDAQRGLVAGILLLAFGAVVLMSVHRSSD